MFIAAAIILGGVAIITLANAQRAPWAARPSHSERSTPDARGMAAD